MIGTYNHWLVLLSLGVATAASYTALDLVGRSSRNTGRVARYWLLGGASAMALGIWSMHFLGMLAYRLPCHVSYGPVRTFLSFFLAIVPALLALHLVSTREPSSGRLGAGAVLLGSGVVGMHYTGMAAMGMMHPVTYVPWIVACSVLIAYVASGAALWIFTHLEARGAHARRARVAAALLMGVAVTGMHYTGMAAARFDLSGMAMTGHSGINEEWLAVLVITGTIGLLGVGLITSTYDSRLESATARLASKLANANEELSFLVKHDPLTKLPNRAALHDRIAGLARSAEESECSLIFIDLDGFKGINDVFGHKAGDEVLIAVAGRLKSQLRSADLVARLGGDEFVVLTEGLDAEQVNQLCARLIASVEQPYQVAGQTMRLSASLGVACAASAEASGADLLVFADTAMYQAKSSGGGRSCRYEPHMRMQSRDDLALLQDLRRAVTNNELLVHYQPKYDVEGRTIIGVEALVRWMRRGADLVSPDAFIPAAEKAGLIVPIGYWVLNEACRQLAEWRRNGCTWTMAVNLSALQLLDPALTERIQQILHTHNLAAGDLVLEVTESTAMQNSQVSTRILDKLHALGVRIAIDDFGTGYSSLLQLKRMPATELKIDRAFVRDLTTSGEDNAIVSAIVALAKSLDLEVVAEGVETDQQRRILKQLGCTSLQGYLLGRPTPPEELSRMFEKPVQERKAEVVAYA